jgi:GDP-D-mannose dehydratase
MKLIVGNTSQISNYFPNDYVKISSRNIPSEVFNQKYEEVHLVFGINVKGLKESLYNEVNYYYTLDLIKEFLKISDKIVIYSTCELWSNCWGGIDLKTPFNFHEEPYILSKWKITEEIKSINSKKIITIYPFNFNSTFRNENFLFGKIFKSIINKEKIEIGDTYFYRDLLHTSYVAKVCQNLTNDKIIGSGRMFFVNDFIRDLYKESGLMYEDFVKEKLYSFNHIPKNEYYLKNSSNYSYLDLINDTLKEMSKF